MSDSGAMLASLRYGFASMITVTFAYGLYVVMTVLTWHRMRVRSGGRSGWPSMILMFTVAMFLLTLVNYATSVVVLEAITVEGPAGTPGAARAATCSPIGLTNLIASTLQFVLSDALMVYRTFMLYEGPGTLGVRMLPIMLWIGFTGLSVAVVIASCGLGANEYGPVNIPVYNVVSTAWLSTTAALQVLTTGMIAWKLLQHRRGLRKAESAALVNGRRYVSLAGLLAESAVLYTAASVAYIPMVRANSALVVLWSQVVGSLVFLNPAYIILRVVAGHSSSSTPTVGSTLHFSANMAEEPGLVFSPRQDASLFLGKESDGESFAMASRKGDVFEGR